MTRFFRVPTSLKGFTIVELLIVIVVIGILAAVTIVAYNGVKQRAIIGALQTDLGNNSMQLRTNQVTSGSYPSDASSIKSNNGSTYQYTVDNTTNPPVFCLTGTNNGTSYYVDQNGLVKSGACTGHVNGGSSVGWLIATGLPNLYWGQVLMNGDGTKYYVTESSTSSIYKSTDSGSSWSVGVKPASDKDVRAPGYISPDASKVFMSGFGNGSTYSFRSTDFGATWSQLTIGGQLTKFSSSTDGSKVYASEYYDSEFGGGGVYYSTNGGVNWTKSITSGSWQAVASSSDGTKVVAASSDNVYLKYSTNSGVSWSDLTNSGFRVWTNVAISSDGTKIAAIGNSTVYTSSDSGATWTARAAPGSRSELAMSGNGMKIMTSALVSGQYVYTSFDGGITWMQDVTLGPGYWTKPSISVDGSKFSIANVAGGTGVVWIGNFR